MNQKEKLGLAKWSPESSLFAHERVLVLERLYEIGSIA
jgi:hypothetical protein